MRMITRRLVTFARSSAVMLLMMKLHKAVSSSSLTPCTRTSAVRTSNLILTCLLLASGDRLMLGEHAHVLDDRRGANRFGFDVFDVLADVFRPDDRVGEASRQNVGEVDNGAQGVVELMGDIARHHAHGHFAFPRAADVARASVERLGLVRYSHGSQPQPPASLPG